MSQCFTIFSCALHTDSKEGKWNGHYCKQHALLHTIGKPQSIHTPFLIYQHHVVLLSFSQWLLTLVDPLTCAVIVAKTHAQPTYPTSLLKAPQLPALPNEANEENRDLIAMEEAKVNSCM